MGIEHGFLGFPWKIPPLQWGLSTVSIGLRTRCLQNDRFILQIPKFTIPLHFLIRRFFLHVLSFRPGLSVRFTRSQAPTGNRNSTPARMAESVDALVSNTSGAIRAGSIPAPGTRKGLKKILSPFFVYQQGTSALFAYQPQSAALTAPVRGIPTSAPAPVGRPRCFNFLRKSR